MFKMANSKGQRYMTLFWAGSIHSIVPVHLSEKTIV